MRLFAKGRIEVGRPFLNRLVFDRLRLRDPLERLNELFGRVLVHRERRPREVAALVENLATDTAWCCDLKMNTAALAIEHLAHRDVVCLYSRLKG